MATVHYKTQVQENGSLDIPREMQRELGIKPGDLVEVMLLAEDKNAMPPPPLAAGESLADFLGDFIGCVEGSGENNSENTSEKFTEHLVLKHKEGHL